MDKHRVVRTRVPVGDGRFVFGSGYLVTSDRLLTARHVLGLDGSARVGQPCEVRFWPCSPADAWLPGQVAWLHPERDVALVAVDGRTDDRPPVQWGAVQGIRPIEWTAMGYPIAARDEDERIEEQAYGELAPLSAESVGDLALGVKSRKPNHDLGRRSGWEGLSGAAVFADSLLIGVVISDPGVWEESLEGIRSAQIVEAPGLADHLGGAIQLEAVTAPASNRDPVAEVVRRVKGAQVSAAVDHWRDRERIRADIRKALLRSDGTPRILTVTGRRGIGKSAIVAKVAAEFEKPDARRRPEDDFNAIAYTSPRAGAGLLTASDVYHTVAALLDEQTFATLRDRWSEAHEAALPDLWEAMQARRTLLVIDNLDDLQDPETGALRDQGILALLQSVCTTPFPPRVLTTSVRAPVLPAATLPFWMPFPVENGLGTDDALALLRSRDPVQGFAELDEAKLREAVERLGGLPFGIDLLAQQLTQDPVFMADVLDSPSTIDELIDQMVPEVFRHLDPTSRLVVQLLALASVALPYDAIPPLLDGLAEPAALRDSVRRLVQNGGVQFVTRPRGLFLQPLEVDWVTDHLLREEADLQIALDRRLADWYRGRRRPPAQWRAPEDVTAQRLEFHHRWRAGDHDEAMAVLLQVARFLARHGDAARVRAAAEAADAVTLGPAGVLARERTRFQVEFIAGAMDVAEAAGLAALEAAEAIGSDADIATVQVELATLWRQQGAGERAVTALRDVAARGSAVDGELRLTALFELGMALCYARRWQEALVTADEIMGGTGGPIPAQAGAADTSTRARATSAADIRSLALLGLQDYRGALAAAEETVRLYGDSPEQDDAGYGHNVAGLAWLGLDDLANAAAAFDNGERVSRDHKIDRLGGLCATNQAWTQLKAHDVPAALLAVQRAAAMLGRSRSGSAVVPQALAEAIEAESGAARMAALRRAVAESTANPDLFSPSAAVCAEIAAALQATTNQS